MRRQDKPDEPADEPLLFDLPLAGAGDIPVDPPLERKRPARGTRSPTAPEPPAPSEILVTARKGPMPVPHPVVFEEPPVPG